MMRRNNRLTRSKSTFIIFRIEEETENLIEVGRTENLEEAKKIANSNPIAYVYSKDSRIVYSTG